MSSGPGAAPRCKSGLRPCMHDEIHEARVIRRRRFVERDPALDARRAGEGADGLRELAGVDEPAQAGIPGDELDLVRSELRAERHQNHAGPGGREERIDELDPVVRQQADAVAGTNRHGPSHASAIRPARSSRSRYVYREPSGTQTSAVLPGVSLARSPMTSAWITAGSPGAPPRAPARPPARSSKPAAAAAWSARPKAPPRNAPGIPAAARGRTRGSSSGAQPGAATSMRRA